MIWVEYVPNGDFAEAVNIKAGVYSIFKLVNRLQEPIILETGKLTVKF